MIALILYHQIICNVFQGFSLLPAPVHQHVHSPHLFQGFSLLPAPVHQHVHSPHLFHMLRVGRICINVNSTDPWLSLPVFSCPKLLTN